MSGDNNHPAPMGDEGSLPAAKRQKVNAPPPFSTNSDSPHLLLGSVPPVTGMPRPFEAQIYPPQNQGLPPAVASAPSQAIHTPGERRNDTGWQQHFLSDILKSRYYPAAFGGNGDVGAQQIARNYPDILSSHIPNLGSLGGSWGNGGFYGNHTSHHGPPLSSGHQVAGPSALNGSRSDGHDLVIDAVL